MSMISDKNIVRAYAAIWVIAYLIVYFFFKQFLPDEYFRDSLLIQRLAQSYDNADGAYGIAAFVARILPQPVVITLVAAIGSGAIWLVVNSLRTITGMILVVPMLAPFLVLNTMEFGKEIFVIPLTFVILLAAKKMRSTFAVFMLIAAIYILYGVFFRNYYLVILLAFLGCVVFRKLSAPLRILLVMAAVMSLFVLPSHFFMEIQGDRDAINFEANKLFVLVHTAIYNPLPPDSAFHFIVNYLYAAVRLTLPFLFRQESSDWILFLNVLFYGRLIYVGLKNRWNNPQVLLPLLFVAHIMVLFIFEPDLGSYLRHASSALLYLLPSLRLLEQRQVDNFRRREDEKKDMPSTIPAA